MHMHIISMHHAHHNLAGKHASCKLIMKLLYFRNCSTRKHSRKKRKEI